MNELSYETLANLVSRRFGKHDVACPLCGPERRLPVNRKRRVLRIWHLEEGFATYACARCGERGWVRDNRPFYGNPNLHVHRQTQRGSHQPDVAAETDREARRRQETARSIWREAVSLRETLGWRYLTMHRGLDCEILGNLSHTLRWHPGVSALIALMCDPRTGQHTGIHRTYLDPAGLKLERKMLGKQGVIRLSRGTDVHAGLGLTEGVEDGLAILLSGWGPVWAATSAGGIERFPLLSGIDCLTIFADADDAGLKAARACSRRWEDQGREVCISAAKELADAA